VTRVSPRSIGLRPRYSGAERSEGLVTDGVISARSGERRWNAVAITASFGRIDTTGGFHDASTTSIRRP
jgi:hypothetical protein